MFGDSKRQSRLVPTIGPGRCAKPLAAHPAWSGSVEGKGEKEERGATSGTWEEIL